MESIENQCKVIQDLVAGNKRFLEGHSSQSSDSSLRKLKEFAKTGQFPKAIVLCCSDSRAPVELIFDQDVGDLFVIRVAGNIVAPSLVGSVEFAASTYGTNVVLVMGHTQCGAVTATLNNILNSHEISSDNIHDIVSRIKPHVYQIAQISELTFEEKLMASVKANILASVSQLASSSTLIEQLVLTKKIKILGAIFELSTGCVHFLEV